ncbi:phage head closure protein [Pandoraea sputorum]|uniref:phage head closure protein n=1 Tax=Pandoraea sputorum TaxID=93222 RepID=UPI001240C6CA|nr:phage head closure protein [Pandoraea sputorum]VVE78180.1 head-tail adaptor protein [Pandoraea sputorum]
MRSGTLTRQVRIERRGAGKDDFGQPSDGWVPIGPALWCNVRVSSGSEAIKSDMPVGEAAVSIRVRYRTDIDNGMRAVLIKYVAGQPVDDEIFNIEKPLPDYAGREYTDLVCVSGKGDGG